MFIDIDIMFVLDMVGTVAFAVSGALVAIKKRFDWYGICILAIITAVGGGILRDIVLNHDVPTALIDATYMTVSIISAVITMLLYHQLKKVDNVIQFFDAVGLGAFTAIGCDVAVQMGHDEFWLVIVVAVLTGTGGGVIRDIFAQKVPFIFVKEIYAIASIAGAIVYYVIYMYTDYYAFTGYIAFAVTLVIRLVAIKANINLGRVTYVRWGDRD